MHRSTSPGTVSRSLSQSIRDSSRTLSSKLRLFEVNEDTEVRVSSNACG